MINTLEILAREWCDSYFIALSPNNNNNKKNYYEYIVFMSAVILKTLNQIMHIHNLSQADSFQMYPNF